MKKKKAAKTPYADIAGSVFEGVDIPSSPLYFPRLIRTGLSVLDNQVLKIGGIPRAKITELSGADNAGKTFFMMWLAACVQAQYPDEGILWIDSENSFDPGLAVMLGLDVNNPNFKYVRVVAVEDTFKILLAAMEIKLAAFFWDSVGNTDAVKRLDNPTFARRNKKGEQQAETPGLHAAALTPGMKKLAELYAEKGEDAPAGVISNQLRDSIGVTFGPKTHTPGGRNLRHNFHMRLEIRKVGDVLDKDDKPTAVELSFTVKRSKMGVTAKTDGAKIPFVKIPLYGGMAKVRAIELYDRAVEQEIFEGTRTLKWTDLDGEEYKWKGAEAAYEALMDKDVYECLEALLLETADEEVEEEDDDLQELRAQTKKVMQNTEEAEVVVAPRGRRPR